MTTIPARLPDVLAIPAFRDNYLWLIHDGAHAAVVDPGDAAPVEAALAAHGLALAAILVTHHHADHTGGVAELARRWQAPVYGPRSEAIGGVTVPLGAGDRVELAAPALSFSVIEVPGHTRGHIAYVRETPPAHWLFCGDTLFAGGCGRLFEGTPAQMLASLAKLTALPDDTLVFCAHEYTLANLAFALAVEPGNADLHERLARDRASRDRGVPTVPSTIGLEKRTNPFLRVDRPAVRAALTARGLGADADAVAAFAALREWKNHF